MPCFSAMEDEIIALRENKRACAQTGTPIGLFRSLSLDPTDFFGREMGHPLVGELGIPYFQFFHARGQK